MQGRDGGLELRTPSIATRLTAGPDYPQNAASKVSRIVKGRTGAT